MIIMSLYVGMTKINQKVLFNGNTEVVSAIESNIKLNQDSERLVQKIDSSRRQKGDFFLFSPLKFIPYRFYQLKENKKIFHKLLQLVEKQIFEIFNPDLLESSPFIIENNRVDSTNNSYQVTESATAASITRQEVAAEEPENEEIRNTCILS
jgi:hypothetical protein